MANERVNLNLFLIFDAVMRCRSVAAASRELGITPSATSHALAKLRTLLEDELFIASSGGMQPTAKALDVAPGIRGALDTITKVLEARPFEPAVSRRTFSIAASDYACTVILPGLLQQLATAAPHVTIRILPFGRLDAVQRLDDGRADLLVGWFDAVPNWVRRRTLFEESEAIVVRAGHKLASGAVTKQRLLGFPHLVVDLTGSEGPGEGGFLEDRGVSRRTWIERVLVEAGSDGKRLGRVAATVPSFAMVAPTLELTDMVATLPRRLAQQAARLGRLVVIDLPYAPLVVSVETIWHERGDADAGLRWLIAEVARAAAQVDAE